jgi:hypothetical protein
VIGDGEAPPAAAVAGPRAPFAGLDVGHRLQAVEDQVKRDLVVAVRRGAAWFVMRFPF